MKNLTVAIFSILLMPGWILAAEGDLSVVPESQWNVSTFKAVYGSYSAWCGSMTVESCGPGDQDGGYGANLDEILMWQGTVANPALPCTVSVDAVINIDTMFGYDWFYISCQKANNPQIDLFYQDALFTELPVSAEVVYEPGDYVGTSADKVVILFRVISDGGWDGADCLWPNDGAVQLDDVVITLSNGTGYSHDFEDGTFGDLVPALRTNVGADVPLAREFDLSVHPNPFNPSTDIRYTVSSPGVLTVNVFDLKGRLVRALYEGRVEFDGTLTWNGTRDDGKPASSGIYFYEARLNEEVRVGKMTLIK